MGLVRGGRGKKISVVNTVGIFLFLVLSNRVYNIEEVHLKTYTFATLIPNAVPCVLQKGPGERGIYLQISEMLIFLCGKGGSTSTLDCVYHCK